MNKKSLFLFGVLVVLLVTVGVLNQSSWLVPNSLSPAQTSEIVELKSGDTYTLTASYVSKVIAGKEQKMLAYNGMIPGPEIHVAQGAKVKINFKNETDLPALLHSHGVRMDSAFDGAQVVQNDIPPGGSFTYELKFPDAGVYWYHPHVEEVYEQPRGLYGAFIVAPSDSAYYPPVNREVSLFLSDLPIENGEIALSPGVKDHALMGHYGNLLLVNGQENFSLEVNMGEVVRFDLINAANARPFRIAIPGARMKVVGSDNGAYEKAFLAESVTLGPSERAIVDVLFSQSGEYEIQNKTPESVYSLGKVLVTSSVAAPSYAGQFAVLGENKTVSSSIDPFRPYFGIAPDKKLKLSLDMGGHMMPNGSMMGGGSMGGMMQGSPDGIEWEDDVPMMGSMTSDVVKWALIDEATGKRNMDIDWDFKKDVPAKIEIYNDPNSMHPMQHPIHFHGQRFLVVSRNGVPQTNLVWKDTVLVKAGERVDIVLDTSNSGTWMAHCHTAEHLAAGMMMKFTIQ